MQRPTIALVAPLWLGGCGLVLGIGDLPGEASPSFAREAGSVDGSAEGSSGTSGTDASVSLLTNGDFHETVTSGCGSGTTSKDETRLDPTARSAPSSCRICYAGAEHFKVYVHVEPPTPGRYRFRAYTRAAPGAGLPDHAEIFLDVSYGGPAPENNSEIQGIPAPDWRFIEKEVTVRAGATWFEASVGAKENSGQGECILVDDLELVRD